MNTGAPREARVYSPDGKHGRSNRSPTEAGPTVIHILEQVAGSLAEAHNAGLIHRDIKPGDILLVDRGGISEQVKVLGFGLVKDVGPQSAGAEVDLS